MQVLFLFIFWLAVLLSSSPSQPGIKTPDTKKVTAAMPVKLITFQVKTDGSSNILEWETTSEVNTREFIIERSSDGKDFSLMYWITPKGKSNSATFYRYTDTTASTQSYYRLRMVDASGKEQVSKIVAVNKQSVSKS